MILAMFRVMLLGLLRDRGALAMAFALPPLIYLIFAAIFAGAAGDELRLRLAVIDLARTATTIRLADAVATDLSIRRPPRQPRDVEDLQAMVRTGEVDAGLVLRADPSRPVGTEAPILIIGDAARAMASPIAAGHVQRLFAEKLPDAAYRRTFAEIEQRFVELSPQQRGRVDAIIQAIGADAAKPASPVTSNRPADGLIERRTVVSAAAAGPAVVYYAGAVGILFLLFSSIQGAMALIDARQNGIIDRLLSGTGSVGTLIGGKFLFLLAQGVVQVGLIFALAAAVYGVSVHSRLGEWLAITFAASAAAASFALLLCVLCRTRQQAQTMSNFLVLVLSAVGGSMVPRFLMPPWLQDLTWLVPNAWAIEAYHALLWRGAPASELALPVALLLAVAAAGLVTAWLLLSRARSG